MLSKYAEKPNKQAVFSRSLGINNYSALRKSPPDVKHLTGRVV